jgi:hypothetical protein
MSKLVHFCISLDRSVEQRLRALATERRLPVSQLVREIVNRYYSIPRTDAERIAEVKRRERWSRMLARRERHPAKKP